MRKNIVRARVAQIAALGASALLIAPASAQNHAEGKLIVDGKPIAITQAYAYAQEGFFDKKKQDVVVLLCDTAVPAKTARDVFARHDLFVAGKAHCVQQTINTDKQVINFEVGMSVLAARARAADRPSTGLRSHDVRRQDHRRPRAHQKPAEIVRRRAVQLRHHLQRGNRAEEVAPAPSHCDETVAR